MHEDAQQTKRGITSLSLSELEDIYNSNELPEDVCLDIQNRPDFNTLIKHRFNVKYIAKVLIMEQGKASRMTLKAMSLDVKQEEIKVMRERATSLQDIKKRLDVIEAQLTLLLNKINERS